MAKNNSPGSQSDPKSNSKPPPRVTTRRLQKMRDDGKRISMLTAYDFPTAEVLDEAGIDILLVGDSLGMVVQGRETTLSVTMDQILYHAEMVARAAKRSMVLVDLPFPEGQLEISRSVQSSARVLQETTAHAVKLEGGAEQAKRIAAIVTAGVPVMAHVGLRPQNIHVDGGYRVQRDLETLLADAKAAEDAGAFAVLVECVPSEIGQAITDAVSVPTIGIGAGPHTTGQVLVTHDMIGFNSGYLPKFVRQWGDVRQAIHSAATQYAHSIEDASFPGEDESF
ncbi:3-methyl-2-oxobutanoate hydroxymethyltransferase [Rubripirellula obstinata]|uniref:3-methyl-2-oxobutanoate hydroxymethyltransferase n=1 Tax=Rubripirellula obstinata TaxID=406547 RepID=A0A5B1CBF0_9BACT|nr:3-methyl-2-oxobutanoate hydroxymethyltransferase [Rubripirellula obstinata]KAA1258427.1 3-methyl-2-oxobutanoate hydroxymethyltransferase [Rubripirellula obstinata]